MSTIRTGASRAQALPWLLWLVAAALFGYGHLTRVAPAGMIDTLMRDFAVGAAVLGNLSAMYWYAYAAIQLPGGILIDRYGPQRVMAASAAICAVGGLLFAYAPNVEVANLGRFLAGAGSAALYGGCIKLAHLWFAPTRFSLFGGLTVLAGMIGGALGQAPLAALVQHAGWRPVMLWVAIAALPLGAFLFALRRATPPRSEPVADAKELWRLLVRTTASRQVWLAILFTITIGVPAISFTLWGVAYYMQVHGHPRPEAALFTSVSLLGWAAGSVLIGWLSGHVGKRKAPAVASAALGLAAWSVFVAFPAMPQAAHFVVMFALGVSAGGIVVGFALVAEHGPSRAVGMATGLANTIVMLVSALVQWLMGAILDMHWTGEMLNGVRQYPALAFQLAFIVMPVISLIALISALIVRETHGRRLED